MEHGFSRMKQELAEEWRQEDETNQTPIRVSSVFNPWLIK
jgi:hypothetical protein